MTFFDKLTPWNLIMLAVMASGLVGTAYVTLDHVRILEDTVKTKAGTAHVQRVEDRVSKLEDLWKKREQRVQDFYREYDRKETEDALINETVYDIRDNFTVLEKRIECLRFADADNRRDC